MPPDKCAKCLKPKSAQGGSITQWVNVCSCDGTNASVPAEEITRCNSCGKPIKDQRSGSLTQWIFQQDGCTCNRPEGQSSPSHSNFKQASFKGFDDQGEVEIEFESGKFPTERYKPVAILGSGVSGTVYLSRDRLLGKRVAVKILRVLDRDALLSFQNEARTTSKLSHPNIIKVLDFGGTHSGIPFMVIEYVPGTSLETLIKDQGGLDFETAITIFIQLAGALEYAHNSHILHRDLKPSNILIVENDGGIEAHLIDFGVAKLQEHLQTTTIYNGTALVGTPAYMSPDQAMGRDFDRRSDIYSLGCIMYETLTGTQAFQAESPLEIIALHAQEKPPDLLDYFEETPTTMAIAKIVETCLAKNPAERYRSADGLRRALNAVPREYPRDPNNPNEASADAATSTVYNHLATGSFRRPTNVVIATSLALTAMGLGIFYFTELKKLYEPAKDSNPKSSKFLFRSKPILSTMAADADSEIAMANPDLPKREVSVQADLNDMGLAEFVDRNDSIIALSLFRSDISPDGLKLLKKLPLTALAIEGQPLSEQHFQVLSELPRLRSLIINCRTTDKTGIRRLSRSNLSTLTFTNIKVSKQILADIATIQSIRHLSLSRCSGLRSIDLSPLARLPKLTKLDLNLTDATNNTLKNVQLLRNLVDLDASETLVTERILDTLQKSKIEKLHLSETRNAHVPSIYKLTFTRQNGLLTRNLGRKFYNTGQDGPDAFGLNGP
ncbi:MAG: serine/threonine-protein kinase [Candidatus Melainabacteria bacterium]|nr:serine/threonine-protein kinase [Candidatus Melainabacteria bacterium]